MSSWFAVTDDGAARKVGRRGVVIGRGPTCDVVLDEPEVSRRHVMLQLGAGDQLVIVPLPNARTTVNGVVAEAAVAARDGDVLAFPGGATIRLAHEGEPSQRRREVAWLFAVGGRRIGLPREALVIGGGEDDVMVETWPPAGAQLTWRDDEPWLEARVDGIARNDTELPRGSAVALAAGDRLTSGSRTITVGTETRDAIPTRRTPSEIRSITLELLPTGGMVTIVTTRGEHRALLAERRFALISILLQPPTPFQLGEYVPDEVVFAAVWPRRETVDRGDLNQLATRLRADLKAAGIDAHVVERYVKGGGTRFVLPAGVVITSR